MKKINIFTLLSFFVISLGSIVSVHANRGPAINEFQEIDMEHEWKDANKTGFDFNQKKPEDTSAATTKKTAKSRYPANSKYDPSQSTGYYIGPLIFLLALPLTFWILISKKIKSDETEQQQGKFFNKTIQFKPYQTDYQKNDDNDDEHYPKAS